MAAAAALRELDAKDFRELRALARPPSGVDDVVAAAICVVRRSGEAGDWKDAQAGLQDGFLEELHGAATALPDDVLRAVYERTARHTVEDMERKSRAAAGLLRWLQAVLELQSGRIQPGWAPPTVASALCDVASPRRAASLSSHPLLHLAAAMPVTDLPPA